MEDENPLDAEEISRMKAEATEQTRDILLQMERDYPGITEGMGTALGIGTGGAGSLAALAALGVPGLSAAGITSGLATAGAVVGGGMVAGIGVLAAPVAALGVAGYAVAKHRKSARLAAALGEAIARLYAIQERLMANAEVFMEEMAGIKAAISLLEGKQPG